MLQKYAEIPTTNSGVLMTSSFVIFNIHLFFVKIWMREDAHGCADSDFFCMIGHQFWCSDYELILISSDGILRIDVGVR
jgi:hypothetical protein